MNKLIKDLSGMKFNMINIISFAYSKNHKSYWNIKCDCGKEKIMSGNNIKYSNTQWANDLCINKSTLAKRIKRGWPVGRALTEGVHK